MGRLAERVYIDGADIARIRHWIDELAAGAWVKVTFDEGRKSYTGLVVDRPNPELFFDANGIEGVNAVLRLEDPEVPGWIRDVWVGDIIDIEKPLPR